MSGPQNHQEEPLNIAQDANPAPPSAPGPPSSSDTSSTAYVISAESSPDQPTETIAATTLSEVLKKLLSVASQPFVIIVKLKRGLVRWIFVHKLDLNVLKDFIKRVLEKLRIPTQKSIGVIVESSQAKKDE